VAHFSVEKPAQFRVKTNTPWRAAGFQVILADGAELISVPAEARKAAQS